MAPIGQEIIAFVTGDTRDVVAAMDQLNRRGDGEGWVNIGPALTEEQHQQLPVPTTLGAWFSGRGPIVPMATWTPSARMTRPRPVVVGIEHGAGPRALDRLGDSGLPLPVGWRKVQDHAKRGIVAELPESVDPTTVVDWLLGACVTLCSIELDGHWNAVVNTPESAPGA